MTKIKFIAVYTHEGNGTNHLTDHEDCYAFLDAYELKYGTKNYAEKDIESEEKPQLLDLQYDMRDGLVSLVVVSELSRLATTKTELKNYLNIFKENNIGLVSLKEKIEIDFEDSIKQ
ncbi:MULTISPECIES: recombinase family protein [unclassified Breznakia]|uniref:recombinase family protein n=1 Tax=unclassified Breznakia TaxID=2623764 RepID=UPI0024057208|nr:MULTISPECIES: recombinase family protein [unclassified Breznakia]MDF9837560.1 DNA invertase Pin-like site-specific DNA recombinase [Breznakia sp. PFB2-8]MDF9860173.1 DNA invertase Pin-like site-specific DNA recombinase [Breznakia sp. PH5-24]